MCVAAFIIDYVPIVSIKTFSVIGSLYVNKQQAYALTGKMQTPIEGPKFQDKLFPHAHTDKENFAKTVQCNG